MNSEAQLKVKACFFAPPTSFFTEMGKPRCTVPPKYSRNRPQCGLEGIEQTPCNGSFNTITVCKNSCSKYYLSGHDHDHDAGVVERRVKLEEIVAKTFRKASSFCPALEQELFDRRSLETEDLETHVTFY